MPEKNRRQILVVDDDDFVVALLRGILTKDGFEVLRAEGAEQALEMLRSSSPGLIITDVSMPGVDGYEFCRKLKAAPETAAVPVLFLTGKNEPEHVDECFACGGADYVGKPFQHAELLARVKTHLRLREAEEELERLLGGRAPLP